MRRTAVPLAIAMAWTIGVAHAQEVRVDTIKAQQPWYQKELYTFPKVVMPRTPGVAAAIQKDLCVDLLWADPDTTAPGHLFDHAWGDTVSGWGPRLNSISWTWRRPFPLVLQFTIEYEGCAAYCEGYTDYPLYDLRNGRKILYDSLFTAGGRQVVDDTLNARSQRLIRAQLGRIQDSLRAPFRSDAEREYFEEARDLYEDCLQSRGEGPYIEDIDPQRKVLRVKLARCSVHANRNADELDPMWFELPYRWLKPYLKPSVRPLFGL